MSNAGRDRQNTAAGRSGGRRKSPRKRLVEQEEVVQAGTTPAIHSSLPIPPDPDIEQERVFHRGISGQAESSSVLEQPLSTSSYTKALSLQNRSARGGPGSLKSQPNGSSSPVKSSTTLRRLPKPVIYGQLRKTSGLTHVSNLCHDLDSIIKIHWNRGSDFDSRHYEDPTSVDWKNLLGDDDQRDHFWQEFEYRSVEEVQSCAERLEQSAAAEAAWNDEVHSAILRIALSRNLWLHPASARVGYSNMCHATSTQSRKC
ncbi:hypothetical protein H2198_009947 [Neophaeococcomyces mojaviensis]|uniref:Uncharacterized protein n=1 Tax=Neophaeococcomyces mojaviensis TaxID=3383035 RepID=A0ACC2ZTC2_9EURO|nr:hypothetical protein H2198_009947 [Knufia sp. JES_112]